MSFKTRLEKLIKGYGLSKSQFGKRLGYGPNPAKLYRLFNDENNNPSVEIIQDILRVFPEINARWLISGDDEMIVYEERQRYGFCKECIKKDGIIEFLQNELIKRDKIIGELRKKVSDESDRISQAV